MGRGSTHTVSQIDHGMKSKRRNLPDGGTAGGLFQFGPPSTFSACGSLALGDVLGPGVSGPGASGPKKVVTKVPVWRRHALAHQLKRVLADAGCNA